MGDGMDCLPGMRAVEASMAGKSKLTADAAEQAALRALSKSEAGVTSSNIISLIVPSPMPTLSPAPSLMLSPVSTTSGNLIHRPSAGGLPRKWSVGGVRSCGFCPGFEGDVIAEAFEAALEIGNGATLADLVEIGVSEIAIDHAPGEHVIGGHDNLVSNGQGGTQRAAPGLEAVELVPQIACLWCAPRKWRRRPGLCADARCPYGHARSSACPRSRSCRGTRRPRRQGGGR